MVNFVEKEFPRSLTSIVLFLIIAFASCWTLWEQDIFWQIRAGDEIIENLELQRIDTWSYTAFGKEWINCQWISTILLYFIFKIGGIAGLVISRGTLAGIISILLLKICRTLIGYSQRNEFISVLITILSFVAFYTRIQIRSEIFSLILYSSLILTWLSPYSITRKRIQTFFILVLATNVHVGLIPFFLITSFCFHINTTEIKSRCFFLWSFIFLSSTLISPYHFEGIGYIFEHLIYFKGKVLHNPEMVRLSLNRFLHSRYMAPSFWIWSCFLGISAFSFIRLKNKLPQVYQNLWISIPTSAVMIWIVFERTRAIGFSVIFVLPLVILGIQNLEQAVSSKLNTLKNSPIFFISILATLAFSYLIFVNKEFCGLGTREGMWPEKSVEFINQVKPQPNIYHTFTYGNYLNNYLRDYKVFADPRETIFLDVAQLVYKSFSSPEALNSIVRQFNIQTMLVKIPGTRFIQDYGFLDSIEEFLPKEDWALVFFDEISIVVLKRIPAHQKIIDQFEYKYLKPNLPHYLLFQEQTDHSVLKEELDRCFKLFPENFYCLLANSTYARLYKDQFKIEEMEPILSRLSKRFPRNKSLKMELEFLQSGNSTSVIRVLPSK